MTWSSAPSCPASTPTALRATSQGSSRAEQEEKHRDYHRRELRHGAFIRSLPLPSGVQSDQAKATYRNGILEIRVPKSERAQPKSVKVEASE